MARDDAVMPVARVTAGIILAVLLAAVIILYGVPGETERWWAWTIAPDMTALVMGAGYAAGAYFFARVLTTRSWRSVTPGFLPITAFTLFMLLATVLHWDRFNHSHPAFFAWTFLYVVTPVAVPALWLAHRGRDPGPTGDELLIPGAVRGLLAAPGGLVVALAVVMMAAPATVVGRWPWELTPLSARILSSYLVLTGASLVAIALDARWRASKILTESLVVGTALLALAVVRDWQSLVGPEALRWANLGLWVLCLLLLLALRVGMERRRQGRSAAASSATARAT